MQKEVFQTLILFAFVGFFSPEILFAWGENLTHPAITEYAAIEKSKVEDYLVNNLGFKDGLQQNIKTNMDMKEFNIPKIINFLKLGGKLEDDEERGLNHFHNPLKPTSEAGLNDVFTIFKGKSNFAWGNGDESSNYYSWKIARESFRDALSATDPSTRDENFAKTFRSVGQVMHLRHGRAGAHS